MRDAHKLDFVTFLSDKKGIAAWHYAGMYPGKATLQPGTFVIGRNKKIVYAYLNEDYKSRAATEAVLAALRKAGAPPKTGSAVR